VSNYQFDVMVIGCGVAGLSAAISLAEKKLKVGVITRAQDPHHSNTYYAQGGIVLPMRKDETLVGDIDRASSYTANLDAARLLLEYGEDVVNSLLIDKAQTPFERDESGNLKFTREAAHSIDRILYRGDFTGKEIETSLLNYLNNKKRFPNVSILTSHTAIDLLTPLHHGPSIRQRYEPDRIVGAYLFNQTAESVVKAMASVTILATGGISALYLHHSNSDGARGDGHAMAKRAGAVLTDMEFIQFHPTTFFDSSGHRRFLISEAMRGEGGRLINSEGKPFMEKYHPDCELAPRDVVARAIVEEMIQTSHECVYLDMTHHQADWLKNRFPTIYKHCLDKRIDITKDLIPVVPAAHYTCGGVKTDLQGRTNLPGLYAIGEVACTGLHGANRLASTSLTEGLVMGQVAAQSIGNTIHDFPIYPSGQIKEWENGSDQIDPALVQQDWMTLRSTMWNYVGLIRTHKRLQRADAMYGELYSEIQRFYRKARLNDALIGLRNAVEVAIHVVHSSKRNKESIGCFYRRT
jgi:L-aspartate oxidase